MRYPPCDKCGKRTPFTATCQAYSDAKKMMVRLCYLCCDDLTGYHPTFESRRKLGENLPKGVRA